MLVSVQSVELQGQMEAGSYVGLFTLRLFQSAGQVHECRLFVTSGRPGPVCWPKFCWSGLIT